MVEAQLAHVGQEIRKVKLELKSAELDKVIEELTKEESEMREREPTGQEEVGEDSGSELEVLDKTNRCQAHNEPNCSECQGQGIGSPVTSGQDDLMSTPPSFHGSEDSQSPPPQPDIPQHERTVPPGRRSIITERLDPAGPDPN